MKRVIAVLSLLPLPRAARDRATLSCLPEGGEALEVTLWDPYEGAPPVECVNDKALAGVASGPANGG